MGDWVQQQILRSFGRCYGTTTPPDGKPGSQRAWCIVTGMTRAFTILPRCTFERGHIPTGSHVIKSVGLTRLWGDPPVSIAGNTYKTRPFAWPLQKPGLTWQHISMTMENCPMSLRPMSLRPSADCEVI